ncbi:MAG: ferrous iron transport protein A [Bdellovibrionales bacterium]|jgi:ferrous iron transport protein A|nr:ferrous iron transport protein A [Bdellovibrionales bacterium]MBT3525966.1 ferrous iron transport protein A [Bdellovibrionales bacterium]MBT7669625.1 ferrous iron transport protein A [Bdellovibrionales bacterium]MBT7765753.1 ferrous iron transport protein A [Bdellovibrionales bacterium]
MEITLRKMIKDQKGVITKINAQNELSRRIRDLGIVPGVEIKMVGEAPLFDPVAIKVKDMVLTLRDDEASYIFVNPSA